MFEQLQNGVELILPYLNVDPLVFGVNIFDPIVLHAIYECPRIEVGAEFPTNVQLILNLVVIQHCGYHDLVITHRSLLDLEQGSVLKLLLGLPVLDVLLVHFSDHILVLKGISFPLDPVKLNYLFLQFLNVLQLL